MEEGQTVEIQETREPLREQGSIRALLELLEQQGMEQEKMDVLCMADYIDSMEMQLGTVLKELGEVKKQLGVMQESKVKLFAVNTIQKAEHQVKTVFLVTFKPETYEEAKLVMRRIMDKTGGFFCGDTEDFTPMFV